MFSQSGALDFKKIELFICEESLLFAEERLHKPTVCIYLKTSFSVNADLSDVIRAQGRGGMERFNCINMSKAASSCMFVILFCSNTTIRCSSTSLCCQHTNICCWNNSICCWNKENMLLKYQYMLLKYQYILLKYQYMLLKCQYILLKY